MNRSLILFLTVLVATSGALAQGRKHAVHQRGMLHQTVYNTGELGRSYDQGTAGITAGFPSFEWPANSATTIDSKPYTGQHNSFGGGIQISATRRDTTRMFAYCGAISGLPVAGTYSFPLEITRSENYPLLPDGSANPSYNPNEAEEIIVSKWATPMGLTVTRTSRAWSHPDYDDFIIYEYEFENTGDHDGNAATPARTDTLRDVYISFAYGLAPGKTGHERTFNRWSGGDFQQADVYARWDRRRWLSYASDRFGKPDPQYFAEWASTGRNGGGLQAPQAVGFVQLYFDTTHLATKDQTALIIDASDTANVWDANGHIKQPFLNRLETSLLSEAKYRVNMDVALVRKNSPYRSTPNFGADWVGRGSFNVRQSWYFGVGKMMIYGPYHVLPGAKLRFALAEVAGYGPASYEETQAGVVDEGGSCGQICGESATTQAFFPVWNYRQTMTYGLDNRTFGSTYLSTYPLPEFVNSNVVTVRDVADRAIEAYTGRPLVDYDSTQYWPEQAPDRGAYQLPVLMPAPILKVENTMQAANKITWNSTGEQFTTSRLVAPLSHYEVQRASHPLGPWATLDSVGKLDPRYFDSVYTMFDVNTKIGESYYYAVLAVDTAGNRSGRTNITLHESQQPGKPTLEPNIFVVPNPFIVQSGFSGAGEPENRIGFYNLPKGKCTIKVLSYSGQLVETIEHNSGYYSTAYMQVTRNNQLIASGVYFFVVETPDGKRSHGKFVIIK